MKLKHPERGSIIVFTVLILGSMVAIALALAAIFLPKIRAAANASYGSVGAFYAADSAMEWCIYANRNGNGLPQPSMSNGATYTISGDCTALPANVQVVGTYLGVSRSLQITTP